MCVQLGSLGGPPRAAAQDATTTPGSVSVQVDGEGAAAGSASASATPRVIKMPALPRPLSLEEKRYLLAVERGDIAAVRR